MSYNYTLIAIENYEKFEFYFILLQEFVIELFDILKVNIILLSPFVLPLLIGYIIGKIHYNRNTYYENVENKITEINDKLAKCDNLISETFNNELDNIDFIINNNYIKLNQQILIINDKIESIQIHMSILNELVYSEINNNNISRTNAIEKMTNLIAPLEKRIVDIETKENYVLIGYKKKHDDNRDIPVFISSQITKISYEEIQKYDLLDTCIILPLLKFLPNLKEIHMISLRCSSIWLSFEKLKNRQSSHEILVYDGSSHIKNIQKIENFCNSIGVKLIIE
uniref:Uncharacterized protein n=1 Tax=viral metagenome TaxID=1070528 RepID=A0A6C0DL46_9ZZZZ